jgi:NADH pyrophosphatase NudC (nudix superfamily)
MSAAVMLQREIAKRMNGDCRLSIQTGEILSMAGDRHQFCSDCAGHCTSGKHASGMVGEQLRIHAEIEPNGSVLLTWACPGCGRETIERTTPVEVERVTKSIEKDSLCVNCRRARTEPEGGNNG